MISEHIDLSPRTGVESPRKTVHEVCQASCGCRWCAAHAHRHLRNLQGSCKRLSQYVVKENVKKFHKSFGENLERFSTSFSNLPLIEKLDELVQKEVTTYKNNSRQRCFKCRKYGHIAKECDKVCKQCFYLHPGKICIINMIQNLQEVLAFNYKNFITFYDITVGKIKDMTKKSYNQLSVTSCPELHIKPSHLIRVVEHIKEKVLVGRTSELQYIQTEMFNKMIKNQIRDYAQQHNIPINKIELIRSEIPNIKYGMNIDVQCKFTKYSLIQRLGSKFSAKCEYNIFYQPDDLAIDDNAFGNTYRMVEKEVLPFTEPVFEIRHKEIRLKQDKRDKIQLDRFNKMLRLYTTQDELQQKKEDIKVAQQQLAKMRTQIEDQTFRYVFAKEEYDEKMKNLRAKYKEIKSNLIQETKELKSKNFQILNKVRHDCKVAANQVVREKREKIKEGIKKIEKRCAIKESLAHAQRTITDLLYRASKKKIKFFWLIETTDNKLDVVDIYYRDNERNDNKHAYIYPRKADEDEVKKFFKNINLRDPDMVYRKLKDAQHMYEQIISRIQQNVDNKVEERFDRMGRQSYDSESEDED